MRQSERRQFWRSHYLRHRRLSEILCQETSSQKPTTFGLVRQNQVQSCPFLPVLPPRQLTDQPENTKMNEQACLLTHRSRFARPSLERRSSCPS